MGFIEDLLEELLREGNPLMKGQLSASNMNVSHLPSVWNPEAEGYSTVYSEGIGTDEGEVLIPRIKNGRYLTSEEAQSDYRRTGENFGKFNDVGAANIFAQMLHREQEREPYIRNLLRSFKF
jgi:hypothetical protein